MKSYGEGVQAFKIQGIHRFGEGAFIWGKDAQANVDADWLKKIPNLGPRKVDGYFVRRSDGDGWMTCAAFEARYGK